MRMRPVIAAAAAVPVTACVDVTALGSGASRRGKVAGGGGMTGSDDIDGAAGRRPELADRCVI